MARQISVSEWDADKIKFFKLLATRFDHASDHHRIIHKRWQRISMFVTLITMTISFSALCVELIFRDNPFVKYYGFSEKVIIMIMTSFIFAANPSDIANNHDKSCSAYLGMVSRITTQLNRTVESRKDVDSLLTEMKYKYDVVVERTAPPKELRFPIVVWNISASDKVLLGSLYREDS